MPEAVVRVLLIEDDQGEYLLAKELFAELPPGVYHLDRVTHYDGAIQAIDDCHHDLYLVDYRLGSYTGLDLMVEAIRRGCAAPMIILTGQLEREIDLRAMKAGAVDYLVKDRLDAAMLERSMRYALQQRQHAQAVRQANLELEERVEQRTAELEAVNQTLQLEIAERKRAEEALRVADRRKDEFLATLAHELRNPLSPLVSAAQLISMDPENGPQVKELAAVITRQLEQLIRLIEDLLDVSRIGTGKLKLRREAVQLREAIEAALDMCRTRIDTAGHTLTTELPLVPLIVEGDKVRLTQIVTNLLINAAKYTPPQGKIRLEVVADGNHAVVRVRDNGVGIPQAMQAKIFELFAQVDDSQARSHGGLGIGLTLVKALVEMHGGTIQVASDGPGTGSEFIVRLPMTTGMSAAAGDGAGEGDGTPLPGLKILVVDDNRSASHLLRRLLEKLGQEVRVANAARPALEIVPAWQPDLVISDIAMPEVTGHELAARIRALPGIRQPVLVALTGYGQESDREEALAAGFDLHLTKPVGLTQIEALLADVRRRTDRRPR